MKSIGPVKKHKKGLITREKILTEAINHFSEDGFTKASTRGLVRRVGMTSSAIYNHFENKEEILFTIIQLTGDKVLATLNSAIEEYEDPEECLKQMIIRMIGLFRDHEMRKEISIFIEQVHQLPKDLRKICNQKHREIFQTFKNKVSEFKKNTPGCRMNETVASFTILGAMNWVYQWYKDSGNLSIADISDEIVFLIFDGLKGKEKKKALKRKKSAPKKKKSARRGS